MKIIDGCIRLLLMRPDFAHNTEQQSSSLAVISVAKRFQTLVSLAICRAIVAVFYVKRGQIKGNLAQILGIIVFFGQAPCFKESLNCSLVMK